MNKKSSLLAALCVLAAAPLQAQIIADFEIADSAARGFSHPVDTDSAVTAVEWIADPSSRSTGVLSVSYDGALGTRGSIEKASIDPKNAHVISILAFLPDSFPATGVITLIGRDNVHDSDSRVQIYDASFLPRGRWVPLNYYVYGNYLADTATFNPYTPNQLGLFSVRIEAGTYRGKIYFDDLTLLGDVPKIQANFETGSLNGWSDPKWNDPSGISKVELIVDPNNTANHVMSVAFDASLASVGQLTSGLISCSPDDHVMAFKIWVPSDFPDGVSITIKAQDQVNWVDGASQTYSGSDLKKGQWNELYLDILRFYLTDSTQFVPYAQGGLGRVWLSFDNNYSFTGAVYFDDIILCRPILPPDIPLESPTIKVTAERTDMKDPFSNEIFYYNRIEWTDLDADRGETYSLYFSEKGRITDVKAEGVIQISRQIPRAVQVYDHRIYTADGAEKTVYYAMTVSGVDSGIIVEKPVRDSVSNSDAVKAKTSMLYTIPFVDSLTFTLDSTLKEFETVAASLPRTVFRNQSATGPKAAAWDSSSKDMNFKAYCIMDKSNMYIGVHVIDDSPDNDAQCWEGDGFDMFGGLYDVRKLTSYFRGIDCQTGGELGGCYRIGAAVGETQDPHLQTSGYQSWAPLGAEYAQKILSDGYIVEFKIPFAAMNETFNGTFTPEEGMILPLKFDINDNDGPDDTVGTGEISQRSMQGHWGGIPGNFQGWLRAEHWTAPAVLVKTDVGVKSKRPLPAGRFALNMNQLGRGNRCISFSYHIPVAVAVKITLHDLQGREIQTLVNAKKAAGSYRVKWNGTSRAGNKVSAGIYFCRMTAPGFVTTQKMILR
jgi:hypothetical protein